ncbi:hypothetical protein Cob_v004425 [Colletotrichum orbiculare MAFF 240422]|uniref:Uncharacterized protein n=1 Tax=Colletotrichum orbiculare (strain 104-T / ATCC 96160 / CBS 514.97 / LARS 414 / MAFF 240422) TaxID=1213857 RepID=A0A484FY10_COLOR|nr:hypothetical protein Cob_v004425 [Colletotrichum orbiculare MAFF 240422]
MICCNSSRTGSVYTIRSVGKRRRRRACLSPRRKRVEPGRESKVLEGISVLWRFQLLSSRCSRSELLCWHSVICWMGNLRYGTYTTADE